MLTRRTNRRTNRRSRRGWAGPGAARRGFTLIELLLVLVILGVLAAIVVPKFTGRSEQARKTAALQGISAIRTALGNFELDSGRFPTTEEGINALVERPAGVKDWHKQFDALPRDPWGNPFVYKRKGDLNDSSYEIYSGGPDGHEGGGDDIYPEQ